MNFYQPTKEEIEQAKTDLEESSATMEIVSMVAALKSLSQSTLEHVQDLRADGFSFRAKEGEQRAAAYHQSYEALCTIWNGTPDPKDTRIAELEARVKELEGGISQLIQATFKLQTFNGGHAVYCSVCALPQGKDMDNHLPHCQTVKAHKLLKGPTP